MVKYRVCLNLNFVVILLNFVSKMGYEFIILKYEIYYL